MYWHSALLAALDHVKCAAESKDLLAVKAAGSGHHLKLTDNKCHAQSLRSAEDLYFSFTEVRVLSETLLVLTLYKAA